MSRKFIGCVMIAVLFVQMFLFIYNTKPHIQPMNSDVVMEQKDNEIIFVKRLQDRIVHLELRMDNLTTRQGSSQQSLWWESSWGYRVNVSIHEPNIIDRQDWPVDVYMCFRPVAHRYSVRVIEVLDSYPFFQEIKYQLWNITYHNQTHIDSATITFLVTLQRGDIKDFQIYWSILEKNPPSYSKAITISKQSTPEGTKYIVLSERGWSAEIPPTAGGRMGNITLASSDKIGHTYLHYGATRNFTLEYGGYIGSGNTDYDYVWRGIIEEDESLTSMYSGIIFATYSVRNISLYDQYKGEVAVVNYTYRFYPWGVITSEEIIWRSDDNADYIVGGWVFDQDDGSGPISTFNRVGRKNNITGLPEIYSYPSMYGILSVSWSHLFYDGPPNPWIRVHRINLTPQTIHTITVYSTDNLFGIRDDPGLIIYSPNGTYVDDEAKENSVSLDVDTSIYGEGMYFIVVYCSDEDFLNGYMNYDIELDGTVVTSGTVKATNNYGIIPIGSINVHDLNITDAVGFNHTVKLYWSASDNLDLYVYDQNGFLVGNSTGTSQEETIIFEATSTGHASILVHKYSGPSPSVSYTLSVTVDVGPEYIDAYDMGDWMNISFFHSEADRAIGIDIIDFDFSGSAQSEKTLWYNEGNDSEIDYILWARTLDGLVVSKDDHLRIMYSLIVWDPSGSSDLDRYVGFNNTALAIENPLNYQIYEVEKYRIKVSVFVVDRDNLGIGSVNISFHNESGQIVYYGSTNSDGLAVFEVEREWWNISSLLLSGGYTYDAYITASYNDSERYNYTLHNTSEQISYTKLLKFSIRAYNNQTTPDVIQDGQVYLNSSATNNAENIDYDINGYTDSLGYYVVYIPHGNWTIRFNKTGGWDRITIYLDQSLTNNITNRATMHTLSINSSVEYYLKDWDYPQEGVTIVSTYLIVDTNPSPIDLYWKESFSVIVELRRSDNDLTINGTILWWIIGPGDILVENGYGTTNGTHYTFTYNTSNLVGGEIYSLIINATVSEQPPPNTEFQEPNDVQKSIVVGERPTTVDIIFEPATAIYWNESLTITVYYTDALDSTSIIESSVIANILGIGEFTLIEEEPGKYILYFETFYWDADSYTIIISASKGNYTDQEKTYTLMVYERPTDLNAPTFISIPWQENYTLEVEYYDSRYSIPVKNADVWYEIVDPQNNVVLSGDMSYISGKYVAILDLTSLKEATYTIYVYATKSNYESKIADIVFEINLIATEVSADNTRISIIYEQNIVANIKYWDIDFDKPVRGATATYNIMGVDVDYSSSGILYDVGNGTYVLNISSLDISLLGTFSISIYITKQHYQPQYLTITAVVDPIPTTATASSMTVETEWGLNISISFWYNRTDKGMGIENATNVSFKIYHNNSVILVGYLQELGDGMYSLLINTTQFVNYSYPYIGAYVIYVFLEKTYFVNQTLTISIDVREVSMIATAQPNEYSLSWGHSGNISITYNRTRDNRLIPLANISITSSPQAASNAFTLLYSENGYVLVINATNMSVETTYVLNITIYKLFHMAKTIIVRIYVEPISTIAVSSISAITIEYGLNISIDFWYNRTDTVPYAGIYTSNATYKITNANGDTIITGDLLYASDGEYMYRMNSSYIVKNNFTSSLGTYHLYVYFNKTNYVSQSLIIVMTIEEIATLCYASTTNISLEWNITHRISLYYNRSRDSIFITNASFNITIYNSSGSIIETVDKFFNIFPQYDRYVLEINTTGLETMLYILEIMLFKEYHSIGKLRIFVDVKPIPTFAVPSEKTVTVEYPKNYTFIIWYYTESYNISNASNSYSVYYGGELIYWGNLSYSDAQEYYELFMFTVDLFNKTNSEELPVTLTIEVKLSSKHHQTQVLYIAYTICAINTKLTLSEKSVTLRYGATCVFFLNYTDSSGEIVLADANATYVISLNDSIIVTGSISYDDDLCAYVIVFNSSDIVSMTGLLGTYIIRVTFEKKYYENQEALITVTVQPMESNLEVSETSVEMHYNESCMFTFRYMDIAEGRQILDATATYEIIYNDSVIAAGYVQFDSDEDFYYLVFNSSEFINETSPRLGVYIIHVVFSKQFYEDEEKYLSVNVMARETILELSEVSIDIEYGEKHRIVLWYIDAKTYNPIPYADARYWIYYGDILIISGELVYCEDNGSYYLIFDTKDIINETWTYLGTYTISISICKTLYSPNNRIASVTVLKISTIAYASPESQSIEYGEDACFQIYYLFTNGSIVLNADMRYEIILGDAVISVGEMIYDPVGEMYVLNISSAQIVEQMTDDWIIYTIRISAEKYYCVAQEIVLSLTITKIACMVEISGEEIFAEWGQKIGVEINIIRNQTLEPVYNISIILTGIPEYSWQVIGENPYILLIDTSLLETIDTRNGSYVVEIMFDKEFHIIPPQSFSLAITKVQLILSFSVSPPESITYLQYIDRKKTTQFEVQISHNSTPMSNVSAYLHIYSIEAGIDRYIGLSESRVLGLYYCEIVWNEFPPGYTWLIEIGVHSILLYDFNITEDKLLYNRLTHELKMDYVSGSVVIEFPYLGKKIYLAKMYYYPMILLFMLFVAVGGYKVITWYLLPKEVKEIDKILKMLKKGIFEYASPSRWEYISKMIEKEIH